MYFFECTEDIFEKWGIYTDKTYDNTFKCKADNVKLLMETQLTYGLLMKSGG